jgi:hypothetical protein
MLPSAAPVAARPAGLDAAFSGVGVETLADQFSPSRGVSPSGVCPGSFLPLLWPLLTSVLTRRIFRPAAPDG